MEAEHQKSDLEFFHGIFLRVGRLMQFTIEQIDRKKQVKFLELVTVRCVAFGEFMIIDLCKTNCDNNVIFIFI